MDEKKRPTYIKFYFDDIELIRKYCTLLEVGTIFRAVTDMVFDGKTEIKIPDNLKLLFDMLIQKQTRALDVLNKKRESGALGGKAKAKNVQTKGFTMSKTTFVGIGRDLRTKEQFCVEKVSNAELEEDHYNLEKSEWKINNADIISRDDIKDYLLAKYGDTKDFCIDDYSDNINQSLIFDVFKKVFGKYNGLRVKENKKSHALTYAFGFVIENDELLAYAEFLPNRFFDKLDEYIKSEVKEDYGIEI